MRHNPATLLALGAAAVPAAAWLEDPVPKSAVGESWAAPARKTLAAEDANGQQLQLGWSPRPTEPPSPKALLGRMLMPRLDGFTLGPQTCGYVPTNGNSLTCISAGATCTPQNDHVGCCQPNSDCSAIKTTCMDYAASSAGSCNLPSDFHTLCCGTATLPACYTWVVSTSAQTDESASLYTLFDCSPSPGRGTLLTVDPAWSSTHASSPATTTSEPTASATAAPTTSTSDAPASTPSGADGGNSSNGNGAARTKKKKKISNIGAIAGGAAGGAAALGLVATAAFLLFRRRKPAGGAGGKPSDPTPLPPMAQQPQSPTSPGGAAYPSGMPAHYQPGYAPLSPQQGYDPHMNAYGQQGVYLQQQQFPAQYPPQQQYGYAPVSGTSPPPHTSPSPGLVKEGQSKSPLPQQPPTELAAVNPVGAETNRAELGS